MPIKQRDVYTAMYFRNGGSYGVTIPPDLREIMKLLPGDRMAMNFTCGVLWMIKITPESIIPRKTAMAIVEKLFPGKVETDESDR